MLPCRIMLPLPRSSRRIFLTHALSLAATAGMVIVSGGCASLIGVQDAQFDLTIPPPQPGAGTSFFWFNELDIQFDTSSISRATLLAATVDIQGPAGTPDLSFLKNVVGTTVVGEQHTVVATCDSFPAGEQAVVMNVKYHDDLRPLLRDGHIIHIEWTGQINPAFTQWPAEGFSVRARLKVEVE
jgi:hypothetical protein